MIARTTSTNAATAMVPSVPFATSLGLEVQDFPKELVRIIMEYNLSVWMLQHPAISPSLSTQWLNRLQASFPHKPKDTVLTLSNFVQEFKPEARYLCIPESMIRSAENEVLSFAEEILDQQSWLSDYFDMTVPLYFPEVRTTPSIVPFLNPKIAFASDETDQEDGWHRLDSERPVRRLCIASNEPQQTVSFGVFLVPKLGALVIKCPQLTSLPSASLPYDLQFLRVECSQAAVPSLLKLLATYSRVEMLKRVILVTYPAMQVPAELQQLKNSKPDMLISWNGQVVNANTTATTAPMIATTVSTSAANATASTTAGKQK